jgi:hypothetical protein
MKNTLAYILGMILFVPVTAFIVQYLWNNCLALAIDPVNQIGYWQAFGIYILSNILFKSTASIKNNIKKNG